MDMDVYLHLDTYGTFSHKFSNTIFTVTIARQAGERS